MAPWRTERAANARRRAQADDAIAHHRGGVRAITDAPPPRAGLWLLGSLLLVLAGLLLWASLGRMDVVAFAQGRTVVSSRVQPVQSVERARATEVLVEEGERVEAGDPLIYLERDSAKARVDDLAFRLEHRRAERARIRALLAAEPDGDPRPDLPEDIRARIAERERARLTSQWNAYRRELEELRQELRNRQAEVATTRARIASINEILPYPRQRVARMEQLVEGDVVPVVDLDEARQELVAKENERRVQQRALEEAKGRVALTRRQMERTRSEFRSDLLDELARTESAITELRRQLVEARARLRRHTLRAPIDGLVQDVKVHAGGTVVEPSKVLMRVVPEDRPVEVEAKILNRDIGFAREGQEVDVKFDTFDFTRYGVVPGTIREVSRTSTEDEDLGRVYRALIELERNTITVNGDEVRLRPGMTATVDVEMGQRRIIEYFLGPILRYSDEALRER